MRSAFIAVIVLAISAIRLPAGAKASLEPHQYTLALQKIQDQIVAGDKLAHEAQREMLVYMAGDFAKARVVDWQKKKNAEALLIYILSGGHPEVVEKLLTIKNQPNLPEGVLRGALEFVLGNFDEARRLLKPVKPEDLSINAGAQIALVKATLYADKDYKKSLKLLAKVRLWKPGTLLEEAALRRALALAATKKKQDLFLQWSSQYTRRFGNSFYLPDFISNFSYYAAKMDFAKQPHLSEKVTRILNPLKERQQASVYLTVARVAVIQGKKIQGEFMARKAMALLKQMPAYSARAKLYLAASLIATPKQSEAILHLSGVDRFLLDEKDQKIYDAAGLMIEIIQKKPPLLEHQVKESVMPDAQRKLGESLPGQTPKIVTRVKKLIKNANDLLEAGK